MNAATLLLVLDLVGTFAFALNGALTAIRAVRVDLVGVLSLGMVTALGGGVVRDVIIGSVPPATFQDWRYLVVAISGSLVAFFVGHRLRRINWAIQVVDAIGLGLFAVTGASKALAAGLGPVPAVLLGGITAVGGGVIRDVLLSRVPSVLTQGLYATPALLGALITVLATAMGWYGAVAAVIAAAACIGLRLIGGYRKWNVPGPRTKRSSS